MSFLRTLPRLVLLIIPASARAQEVTNTPAATQPGAGVWALRERLRFTLYDDDVRDTELRTQVGYGLRGDTSAWLDIPALFRIADHDAGDERDVGLGDLTLQVRHRFLMRNDAAVDTLRVSAIAGLEIPSGDEPFTSRGWNPTLGAVLTRIKGRHGFNAGLSYTLTTDAASTPHAAGDSLADLVRADASWAWRLAPAAYTPESRASWYVVGELNSVIETNGDLEVFLSPGILFEAVNIGLECSLQLPVIEDLDHRPGTDYSLVFGIRWLF